MSRITAVEPVVPEFCYTQAEITAEVAALLAHDGSRRVVLERVHGNSGIDTRYTALPLESYRNLGSFRETNETFVRVATDLTARALSTALELSLIHIWTKF